MQLSAADKIALEKGQPIPVVIDQTECVVIRRDIYDRVKNLIYDDSDWSDSEIQALGARASDELNSAGPIP